MDSKPYLAAIFIIAGIILMLTVAIFGVNSPEVKMDEKAIELFEPELDPEIEAIEYFKEVKLPSDFENNLSPETKALIK